MLVKEDVFSIFVRCTEVLNAHPARQCSERKKLLKM